MSLYQNSLAKHTLQSLKNKIKDLSYSVEVLRCRNQALIRIKEQLEAQLGIKEDQIQQLAQQLLHTRTRQVDTRVLLDRIKRSDTLVFCNSQNQQQLDWSRKSIQNRLATVSGKASASKEIGDCPLADFIKTADSLPIQLFDRIEELCEKHFPQQIQLKPTLMRYIQRTYNKVSQGELLENNQQLLGDLAAFVEQAKKTHLTSLVGGFVQTLESIVNDSSSEESGSEDGL